MNKNELIKQLRKQKQVLAKDRDKFRELAHEAQELEEKCEAAIEAIESAVDSLSELV